MGFFDDLAMGTGLKDRDDDYYERTAQTLGRESQGGSAQREAQYRGSMGMNNGATVGGGQLDKRGGLLPFMEGGGTIGAIARGIGGKGGGKTEQASNSQDLGLGGLQSFLGTRGPAAQSELGNAQMQATLTDNLPGYFDPATREYVPWYVDMFNGGGFNSAGGEDAQTQAALPSAQASASPRQISPQARPVSDPRNLGGSEGYGPMGIDPRNLGGSEGYGPMGIDPRNLGGSEGYGPMGVDPRNLGGSEGYGPMGVDPRQMGGASGYGQTGVAQQMQPAPQNDLNSNPEYQRFIQGLIDMGGFEREMQNPEWLERMFRSATGKDRL